MENKNGVNPLSPEDIEKQKAELEILVNSGKLTRESALAIAEKLGLISAAKIERTSSITKSTQLFNFSVYKWSKGRTVQRLILQFDFQSKTLSSIQHGTRTKKVSFTEINSYQSEDGLRLTIQFSSQNEYELDADTQEDKNKMCRLLEAVMRSLATPPNLDPSEYTASVVPGPTPYSAVVEQITNTTDVSSNGTIEQHGITSLDAHTALSEEELIDKALLSDSGLTSPIISSPPIKEDMVEKKGHSAKFMLWAKRWLRVCEGELMYSKPEDIESALNIIPLTPGLTEVKKISHNQFNVNLIGSNRVFNFRALASGGKSSQQNRDEWCEAIQSGCYKRRESAAGLRKGTVTAKQLMPKAPTSSIIRRLTLRRASSPNDPAGSSPPDEGETRQNLESPPQVRNIVRRSRTFAGNGSYKKPPRLSFRNKSPDEAEDIVPVAPPRSKKKKKTQRSGSQFYDNEDITRRIIEPRDFPELNLKDKGARDLLLMLRPQFNELVPIFQTFTIGSSEADQMIIRIDSIICALEEEFSERTGTPLRERSSVTQSDTQDESSSSPEHKLSTVIEQSTSNRSSRHTSPAVSAQEVGVSPVPGVVSPVPGALSPVSGVVSPARTTSPSASDELTSEGDSEIKIRSGASSRSSLRMSLRNLISPEELEKVLSPEELKHMLGEMEMDDAHTPPSSHKSTPITSPILEDHISPPPATPPPGVPSAPPPPPLFPGIPGAPPPPPLFPGVPGAPPPPPPLGGGGGFSFPSLLPPKNIPTPGVKLRKIHWDPLKPQIVMESGWMEWGKNDKIPSIDLKDLEKLFGVDTDKDKKPTPNLIRKIEMKTLLDTTRSRNIEIFLPTFPYPLVSLSSTLDKQLNVVTEPSELGLDHVIALKRYQPTVEEREMYKKYPGDKNNLQNGDIFLVKLCEVPLLSIRLDLLFTIREFPSNFEGFQPSLDLAWQATRELKNSKHFVDVLCYVLAVGNYLNAGSRQGGAYGFRLAILPKLVESYGQNKKMSLLHFLVQQIHSKQPELLDMPANMEAVAKSSDISITGISAELEVMQRELDKIERYANKVVEQSKMDTSTADKLLKDVKGLVKQYREELTNLDSKGHEMNENYRELLKQFGEPPNTDSEDFFSQVAKFLTQFKRVSLELYPPPPPPPSPKVERRSPFTANKMVSIDEVDKGITCSLAVPSIVQSPSTDSLYKTTARPKSHIVATLNQVGPNVHKGRASTIQRSQLKPKDGFLEKLTKDGKKWKKRYFELEASNLHYYEGKKYCDSIKLYCVPIKLSSDDHKVVMIETDKRVWSLRAESESAADDWITALQMHSQGTAR